MYSWNIQDLENMFYWEREVYLKLLSDYIEEQKIKRQQQEQQQGLIY